MKRTIGGTHKRKRTDAGIIEQLLEINSVREEIGLPLLKLKTRTCMMCRLPFTSVEARRCIACNVAIQRGQIDIPSLNGYDII